MHRRRGAWDCFETDSRILIEGECLNLQVAAIGLPEVDRGEVLILFIEPESCYPQTRFSRFVVDSNQDILLAGRGNKHIWRGISHGRGHFDQALIVYGPATDSGVVNDDKM